MGPGDVGHEGAAFAGPGDRSGCWLGGLWMFMDVYIRMFIAVSYLS